MNILGISAFYHDSAAAIIQDGVICAAAQEERFSRIKHDPAFPARAIAACLRKTGLSPKDIDSVAFYDKPFIKFERLLETYLSFAPRGFRSFQMAMPIWLKDKLFQKSGLIKALKEIDPNVDWGSKLLFSEHHVSHAASAFFPSPFEKAAVLTLDGVGEWATTTLSFGDGRNLEIQSEQHFPHSLGLLYSAFTYFTGFKVNSGEYKVMGLAPYGTPRFSQTIFEDLIDLKEDGSFRLNLKYFDYCTGFTMTNEAFDTLFDGPPRNPESLLTQREMDLAASVQAVTEEIVLKLSRYAANSIDSKALCLAGGVALNCVANGSILRTNAVDDLWIQPAAGDAGGAIGAALAAWHLHYEKPRSVSLGRDAMSGAYLGPSYEQSDIEARLSAVGAVFEIYDEASLISCTVAALEAGDVVGWHQGAMEFGPRALGGRSILGDPRRVDMQKTMNLRVKYRESFRPFAPSVLREDLSDWFDLDVDSPYMLLVANVVERHRHPLTDEEQELWGIEKLNIPRSSLPAVTHVDYSARIQTVHADSNPRYYALLQGWKQKTGCPVLINTSFNIRGEPIVESPEDAYRCFMGCEIEILVIGNCILRKKNQDPNTMNDYRTQFALD